MTTRDFHLGDVLTILTDRLVSPDGVGGIYEILGFMLDDTLFTHQLTHAATTCKPYLVAQFPQLTGPTIAAAIADLDQRMAAKDADTNARAIVAAWLEPLTVEYGTMLAVAALPPAARAHQDPFDELRALRPDLDVAYVVPLAED